MSFPYIPNTTDTLFRAIESTPNNLAQSTLVGNILAGDLSINVANGANFVNGRFIVLIDDELIIVQSVLGNALTIEQRGAGGTIAASHINGSLVTNVWSALQSETTKEAILTIESFINYNQTPVNSIELDDSALTPTNGDRVLINGVGVNGFVGQDNTIAEFDSIWYFIPPLQGMRVTDLSDNSEYYFDGVNWHEQTANSALEQEIVVAGVTQGNYEPGDVIPIGTAHEEIFRNMLIVEIEPTFINPTLSFTSSITGIREVGESISPVLTATFNQNDAGTVTAVNILRDAGLISTDPNSPFSITDTGYIVQAGTQTWNSSASHNAGDPKNSNLGNPFPNPIGAGTINSVDRTVNGIYPFLFGMDSNASLSGTLLYDNLTKLLETQSNKSVLLNGTAEYIYFCYPNTYPDLSSIIDQNGFNVTASFQLSTISVTSTGLGSNYTQDFKVYRTINITTVNSGVFQFNF